MGADVSTLGSPQKTKPQTGFEKQLKQQQNVCQEISKVYGAGIAEFLQVNCGSTVHSENGVTLLEHLGNTAKLLREWGYGETLQLAGLFHSIYSTEYFEKVIVPKESRDRIVQLIGVEAEQIAYMFCAMNRREIYQQQPLLLQPEPKEFQFTDRWQQQSQISTARYLDLYVLMLANWMEQRTRYKDSKKRAQNRDEFFFLSPYLTDTARKYLHEEYKK